MDAGPVPAQLCASEERREAHPGEECHSWTGAGACCGAGGQFCDRGDSYRTAVFVTGPAELAAAQATSAEAAQYLAAPIATVILPAGPFHAAEEYHQDYCKSGDIIITRFGPRTKASAYKLYRESCGRDARIRQLWGSAAFGN